MFARALIVLLVVLNVGVAIWWAVRPAERTQRPWGVPTGTPALVLLRESPHAAAAAASSASKGLPQTPSPPPMCLAFGPFSDAAAAARASAMLQAQVKRLRVRTVPGSGHGWRVWLPPSADRAAAQAVAARIAAAGFKDYYIQSGTEDSNAIALGRYGNEDSARRRQAALQAAGIPAQAEALGASTQWIDAEVRAGFDADRARARAGAALARPLDCATLP